nr:hypothetical protein GCM10020241_48280 [Streptoalloteichus tenebrarius]
MYAHNPANQSTTSHSAIGTLIEVNCWAIVSQLTPTISGRATAISVTASAKDAAVAVIRTHGARNVLTQLSICVL